MPVLTSQQRSKLEAAVKQARKFAENGACEALRSLAVDHPEPFVHMDGDQRSLRNILRSKARLLGDELLSTGVQKVDHLAYELAYETWHKMLFAKFLEANGLLMHPDGVAVTLEDCEELSKEEHFADKWDAAAEYASKMLPAIFRPEDPLMEVRFAPNDRIKLEEIIAGLEEFIFTADDALGWVYQFWQSQAKEDINKSGDKIDGAKLPAVTQLFTEPYMVHFLIDNTLGAWWASRNPGVKPPVKFEYLRVLEDGTPAAGKFEGWPDKTAEVTTLDPCMGSGHFLISLFSVMAPLRMAEEGLSREEATDKVIAQNLHGLEIDPRCTQIAAFNLALTAWKFCGYYRELPEMNLACSGIAPKGKVEDWVKLVGKVDRFEDKERMENGIRMLYNHFQLAPELGSLLDPTTIKADVFTASFEELQPVLKRVLESEADTEQLQRGVMASGIAKAGQILANKYTLQITNVPYLSVSKQSEVLYNYGLINFPRSRHDLATVFLEKLLQSNNNGGTTAVVIPQNWNFLPRYKHLRKYLLTDFSWNVVTRLGPKCFQTQMWDFNVLLFVISKIKPNERMIFGIDVSEKKDITSKDDGLKTDNPKIIEQKVQMQNPDMRIVIEVLSNINKLSKYADSRYGLRTADTNRFINLFWETNNHFDWEFHQSSVSTTNLYTGRSNILLWENGKGSLSKYAEMGLASLQGSDAWRKMGIVVSLIGNLPVTIYNGDYFDNNCAVVWPFEANHLDAIWSFCSSNEFKSLVRKLDQKLNVTNATLLKIPFDLEYWQKVAAEKYPNGLPKPYSDDPTQWLFHGHPIKTDNPLQVAVARLLGYRWPAENDKGMELADEATELIRQVKAFDHLSDEDGIFCIPSVNAEPAGSVRLRDFLQSVFETEWNNQTVTKLLEKEGATTTNLEEWLRKEFFIQHCKVFQNRPFIWHIWDGRNDGFSALVNYHKLNRDNLSKLIYTYLGDWIRMSEAKRKAGESGAEGLLSAALKLKEKLELILEGEAPYDIFVRWKPLDQQPIGWDPDLNDGVRLNIRPFMEAGVLRKNPNIKWGIDRGKNPPGSPWGEIRDNDKHLSLADKRSAREKSNLVH